MQNKKLMELLQRRGQTVRTICKATFCGECSVSQILGGHRTGTVTWNKLKKVFDADELTAALEYANARLSVREGRWEGEGDEAVLRNGPCRMVLRGDKIVCEPILKPAEVPA